MARMKGALGISLVLFVLIVSSVASLLWALRSPLLVVIDARYRELYGTAREKKQLRAASMALFRRLEVLSLDDSADPTILPALIASRSRQPRAILFPHWLAPWAQAVSASRASQEPESPPVPCIILGGEQAHPSLPSVTIDYESALSKLAALAVRAALKAPVSPDTAPGRPDAALESAASIPRLALCVPPERASSVESLFRLQPQLSSGAVALDVYVGGPPPGALPPAVCVWLAAGAAAYPESWRAVPLALELSLDPEYLPPNVFALVDSSPWIAIRAISGLGGDRLVASSPARLQLLSKRR